MADVPVISPAGAPGTVPEEDLTLALEEGYRLQTPDEAAAGNANVLAAFEAGARGASFGLSDPLIKGFRSGAFDETQDQAAAGMKARREQNPLISTGAELVGAVIAPNPVAKLRAGTLLGRTAAGVAEGATLWGLGAAVSESALEDAPLTADKLAAGMLAGGLAGGAFGAALHGFSRAASAIPRPEVDGLRAGLRKAADEVEWRQLMVGNVRAAKRLRPVRDDLLEVGRREGVIGLPDEEAVLAADAVQARIMAERVKPLTEAADATVGLEAETVGALTPKQQLDAALRDFELVGELKRLAEHRVAAHDAAVLSPLKVLTDPLKRQGVNLMGRALDELAGSEVLPQVAKSFERNLKAKLALVPGLLGAVRGRLEDAAARGGMDLLVEHARVAQSAAGPDYLARLGMEPEAHDQIAGVGQKLKTLATIQRTADAEDRRLDSAIKGFFGQKPGRAPAAPVRDFDRTLENVRRLAHDPEGAMSGIPPALMGAAPALASEAMATAVRAAQFLDSKAPKDPNAGLPEGLRRPWRPSDAARAEWLRYVDAVENPSGAVERMASGVAPKEALEALQTVYPRLFEEMKARMLDRLAALKTEVPYSRRVVLSRVLGPQALGLRPEQIQYLQRTHGSGSMDPQAGPKGPDGRQNVNATRNLETQAQRLEGR